MAGLIRTSAGLANAHLFYNADIVLYCESDPRHPLETSVDAGYWAALLQFYSKDTKVAVRPLGNKAEVLKVVSRLRGSRGHHTICAVDRDYSDLHQEIYDDPYILYTWGYSVENDLVNADTISRATNIMMAGPVDMEQLREEISADLAGITQKIRWIVIADQILSYYFLSLIPRDGTKFKQLFSVHGEHDLAVVRTNRAIALLQKQKAERSVGRALGSPKLDLDILRRLHGHTLWWIAFRICRHALRKRGHLQRVAEQTFSGAVIAGFVAELDKGNETKGYFKETISDALACALEP